jgi:hypothetical protein
MLELLEYLKYEATFQSSLYRNLNDEIVKFNDGDFHSFCPFFFFFGIQNTVCLFLLRLDFFPSKLVNLSFCFC